MKHKIILAFGIAIVLAMFFTSPAQANPCYGRQNCVPLLGCDDCGCAGQPICVCPITNPFCGRSACDPRHNPTGICTPCGEAWQAPCWFESPACDQGTINTGVLCVPCGDPWHPPCPSEPRCDPGYSPLPAGFPVICAPCGDTWYPECSTGDPCEPWHNAAVICTPCGGEMAPLCWSGEPCKPGYEVEGWEFPLCTAKPAVGPEPDTGYLGPYDGLMPEQPEGEPLSGWVATHEHQFANLAYGGVTYWGEPFNGDGVSVALAECDYTDDPDLEVVLPSLWGEEDAADFMGDWLAGTLNYIPTEYPDVDLTVVETGLQDLAAMLLDPLGPVGDFLEDAWDEFLDVLPWEDAPDWLEGLLNDLVDGLQGLLDDLFDALLGEILPMGELAGPALVRGLYLDLAPWDPLPPVLSEVPRYGVHGDDRAVRPDSPSQFWLGLTQNMAVNGLPWLFHHGGGYPNFEGWPTYENGGHQQMYYKWVERAYQAGLRLLVNLPVNNEVICEMSFQQEGFGCDDMDAVDRQIEAIYALEAFIDKQNDGQVDGDGWYRVALSASEARQIIEDGAMAVIIGIEVDNLFGCKPDTNYCCQEGPEADCLAKGYTSYEDFIAKKVQEYYDKGVRYIFPVHFWDNKFTGGAPYRDIFTYAQLLANGNCYDLYDCSEDGYSYHIGDESAFMTWFFNDVTVRLDKELCSEYGDYEAACNSKGLTPEGITLFKELIERDMLIDQDHLPVHSSWGYSVTVGGGQYHWPGLLDIAEDKVSPQRGYKYPVVSSHSAIRPDYDQGSEGGTSVSIARRIRDLGGVVAVPQPRDECSTSRQFVESRESVEDLVFHIGLEYTGTLEAGALSPELWIEFASQEYTLTAEYTGSVVVETVEPGQEWRIRDWASQDHLSFRVRLDEEAGERLEVHDEHFLFTLGLEYTPTLEAGQLSPELWNEFATNEYTLTAEYTGSVVIETVEAGLGWRIKDSESPKGRRYRVQLDDCTGDTLNVHRATYKLGYIEHAEFMSYGLPEEHQAYPRIGLRSDFGAFLPQGGPRYQETVTGTLGYCDERDTVSNMLQYPYEPLMPDEAGEFTEITTGNKTWDYNYDGLAHIGLWPDLLADARTLYDTGETTSTFSLDPMMHSAEAYLRMWEWIENCTPDEVPPDITCPGTVITTGGVGGAVVTFDPPPAADDLCDWIPPDVHVLTTDPVSGSIFETGITTVWATATDFTGNASQCSFDVQMSCFQVNHARIGVQCVGLAELELVYNGPNGAQVDVGDFGSFSVDDGDHILLSAADIGQEVLNVITQLQIGRERTTIPTACAAAIQTGDVFGPFTVDALAWVFADDAPPQKVEVKGTFRPAAPVDVTTVDVTYTIDDGLGDTQTYVIPAGSFQVEGKPSLLKFRYSSPKGAEPAITARFDFNQYTFELSLDGVDTYGIAESELTIGLQTGTGLQRHYGLETVPMQITPRQLEYLAAPQWDCSP